ncbi:hypothetical protein CVT24_010371 [Panaeolus cyanescens]|uniref:Uncharacterized protein n=1 Tax=Panaeolus cyanescens TaxID=181874 RepID=A0A409VAJ2_9AGAR|nr:hypothetical protein CVT24_010371 [Panaeolus cyanescens]
MDIKQLNEAFLANDLEGLKRSRQFWRLTASLLLVLVLLCSSISFACILCIWNDIHSHSHGHANTGSGVESVALWDHWEIIRAPEVEPSLQPKRVLDAVRKYEPMVFNHPFDGYPKYERLLVVDIQDVDPPESCRSYPKMEIAFLDALLGFARPRCSTVAGTLRTKINEAQNVYISTTEGKGQPVDMLYLILPSHVTYDWLDDLKTGLKRDGWKAVTTSFELALRGEEDQDMLESIESAIKGKARAFARYMNMMGNSGSGSEHSTTGGDLLGPEPKLLSSKYQRKAKLLKSLRAETLADREREIASAFSDEHAILTLQDALELAEAVTYLIESHPGSKDATEKSSNDAKVPVQSSTPTCMRSDSRPDVDRVDDSSSGPNATPSKGPATDKATTSATSANSHQLLPNAASKPPPTQPVDETDQEVDISHLPYLSAADLDRAKNLVLDLLGWGVQPEYLLSAGLSHELVFRVFADLNLRMPTNLKITDALMDVAYSLGRDDMAIGNVAPSQPAVPQSQL